MVRPRRLVVFVFALLLGFVFLTGCASNQEGLSNQEKGQFISYVQQTVNQYIQITGYPPIKNENEDTPLYQKYLVDFAKLKNYNLIGIIPSNAYENGGPDIYVLINAESKPQVKLMDVRSFQQMANLQRDVKDYIQQHQGKLPASMVISADFSELDASKFPKKETQISSPYSHHLLNIVINNSGQIALDYTADIIQALSLQGIRQPDPTMDLRTALVDQAYYVPAWSYPYYWLNNQITLTENQPS